jgi:hypothetical protein
LKACGLKIVSQHLQKYVNWAVNHVQATLETAGASDELLEAVKPLAKGLVNVLLKKGMRGWAAIWALLMDCDTMRDAAPELQESLAHILISLVCIPSTSV